MSEPISELPVKPVYWQSNVNSAIDLGARSVVVDYFDLHYEGLAPLRQVFDPSPCLQLTVPITQEQNWTILTKSLSNQEHQHFCVRFPDLGSEVFHFDDIGAFSSNDEAVVLSATKSPIQMYPKASSIQSATFHLFNWPELRGTNSFHFSFSKAETPNVRHNRRLPLVSMAVGGWRVTVAGASETEEACDSVRRTGDYRITHVGRIERESGETFSSTELDAVLYRLRMFFKLLFGRESAPSLAVGFDSKGLHVYERLGVPFVKSGAWSRMSSWFDNRRSNAIGEVITGFWNLSERELWDKPLAEAIYWYEQANLNELKVDSSLTLSQAALELLSWNYCVRDRGMVSASAFKPGKLTASDKLRLLSTSLSIPLEIPKVLEALHSSKDRKWSDAMDVITDVRNGLVHPGSEKSVPEGGYFETWKLSMWLLDLIFLRLCDYRGKYHNRLTYRFENVPWAC